MFLLKLNFKQWTSFEKIWFISFIVIIASATFYFSITGTDFSKADSILLNWIFSPISAITGILCVVLAAKGKISNWVYGLFNSILYGYLAYRSGYYGDALINILYFVPTQFIGLFFWKSRLRIKSSSDVKMRKLTPIQIFYIIISSIIITVAFSLCLHLVDSWFTTVMKRNISIYNYFEQIFGVKATLLGPILDASTEVTQILAQILMVLAFTEQWIFWILTNVITIFMWGMVIVANPTNISWALPTMIMWIAYLINSVYGWVMWQKGASNE